MTELERKALLGDAEAQKECTEKGIVLPCPCGAENPVMKVKKSEYGFSGTIIRCNKCGLSMFSPDKKAISVSGKLRNMPINNHKEIAISKWNTRAAPPIGRCGECKKWGDKDCMYNGATLNIDYCSYFEPKQS